MQNINTVSDALPVLTDRKSLLSEDSLLERVIAAAEERQLSIHSSPQPAHNRNFGEVHETKAPGLKFPGQRSRWSKRPVTGMGAMAMSSGLRTRYACRAGRASITTVK